MKPKKLYHLCFTSENEVFCRSVEDYKIMISRIAQSAVTNECNVWVYAVMSNHVHIIAQCSSPGAFIKTIRSSYTQSFNNKYKRDGKLGDPNFFRCELNGLQHKIDAITYVLQNPWHHRVVANPYAYPFSSIGFYYKQNEGTLSPSVPNLTLPKTRRFINRNLHLPNYIAFDDAGMVMPTCFLEVSLVENLFGTYAAYNYLIQRKNYIEWKNKQLEESSDEPIVDLYTMEPIMGKEEIRKIESTDNRWMKEHILSDIEICKMIDEYYVPKYKKTSYVELSFLERDQISSDLLKKYPYRVSKSQIIRCVSNY